MIKKFLTIPFAWNRVQNSRICLHQFRCGCLRLSYKRKIEKVKITVFLTIIFVCLCPTSNKKLFSIPLFCSDSSVKSLKK